MRFFYLLIGLSLFTSALFAGNDDSSWSPDSPEPGIVLDSEWIKLKGGEWLKGDIISFRDDQLTFDSDKFGDKIFKWEDVRELYSKEKMIVVLIDGRVIISRISIIGNDILFTDSDEEADRDFLISFVPTGSNWWELWNGRISSGLNLRRGNTNQTDLQLDFEAVRRSAFNRLTFNYSGNFSNVEGHPIANNNKAFFSWSYFLNHRMYLIPLAYNFLSDPFRNIRQEHSPTIGFGFELLNKPKIKWNILGSGGYRYTQYSSVESGQKDSSQSVILLSGTNVTADLTDSTEVQLSYSINFDLINLKNIVHNLVSNVLVDITNNLELDLMFSWTMVGDPEKRENGTVPEKSDISLTAGISYSF